MPTDLIRNQQKGRRGTTMVAGLHEHAEEEEQQCSDEQQNQDRGWWCTASSGRRAAAGSGRDRHPKMVDTPTTMRIVPVEMFASFMALNVLQGKLLGDEEADKKGVPHRDDRGFPGVVLPTSAQMPPRMTTGAMRDQMFFRSARPIRPSHADASCPCSRGGGRWYRP